MDSPSRSSYGFTNDWWLRAPSSYGPYLARAVNKDGNLKTVSVSDSHYGVRRACNIVANTPVFLWTDGYYHLVKQPLQKIELDTISYTLTAGKTIELTTIFTPEDPADITVDWLSSDESVATVDNWIVTGLDEGQVTITVISKANPSLYATCEITVVNPSQQVSNDEESHSFQSCAGIQDKNCDGVVTCDEAMGPGWVWSKQDKACVIEPVVQPTDTPSSNIYSSVNTSDS